MFTTYVDIISKWLYPQCVFGKACQQFDIYLSINICQVSTTLFALKSIDVSGFKALVINVGKVLLHED